MSTFKALVGIVPGSVACQTQSGKDAEPSLADIPAALPCASSRLRRATLRLSLAYANSSNTARAKYSVLVADGTPIIRGLLTGGRSIMICQRVLAAMLRDEEQDATTSLILRGSLCRSLFSVS